ncbi:CobD/CbiB family cobalamin biosynthesis protein [Halorubrum yunnanense]|uniref:Probable cobalamin biosynthesis protein CobD n=1 Tax=Halorubrum yunnanense TaxID=1526162 RepID=A0ABD5YG64_9EURY|nr:CobD/CbiB family cobalamin biosynthesis protein [Halorubrum yunnanense]
MAALVSPAAPALPAVTTLAVAVALDLLVAEPPGRVHPVALFGSVVGRVDRPWSRPRLVGVAAAVGLPLAAGVVAGGTVTAAAGVGARSGVGPKLLAVPVAGTLLFSLVSLRMLREVTAEVVGLTESDPDAARESVRALVGRDAADLSPADLRSAAVESAAENLADGFAAPLAGFAGGATVGLAVAPAGVVPLAAGVSGAAWVKAVNTLDSMLGYRSKPVGWASARLDDAVMYLPARASAGCLAVAAGSVGALSRARSWAREPESPNSGWPMATAAAALDVRLAKPGRYALNPAAGSPSVADGERAVRLVGVAGAVAVAGAAGWLLAVGWLLPTMWWLSSDWPPAPAGVIG